jgi:hypothetical protein
MSEPLDIGSILAHRSLGLSDIPALVAEIDRLCEEVDTLRVKIAELEEEDRKRKQRAACSCFQGRRNPASGDHHRMSCKNYVGPLEHKMTFTGINGTFGGADFDCVCGGWFRQGGIAGHGDGSEDAEIICPNADQDWRGPKLDKPRQSTLDKLAAGKAQRRKWEK